MYNVLDATIGAWFSRQKPNDGTLKPDRQAHGFLRNMPATYAFTSTARKAEPPAGRRQHAPTTVNLESSAASEISRICGSNNDARYDYSSRDVWLVCKQAPCLRYP